jgi:predicted ATPase/transcriptional regulator with XRE-family HTH domain
MSTTRSQNIFGRWFKGRRKALDLTQAEVAAQTGCSIITIKKIESGQRRPSKELALRLSTLLAISADERRVFMSIADGTVSEEVLQRLEAINAVTPDPVAHATRATSQLPPTPTQLFGRDEEVAAISAMLSEPHIRTVTITGLPGIGKTRVAIEVAARCTPRLQQAVYWISLASINSSDLVAPTIARALHLADTPHQSTVLTIKNFLRTRQVLLVLDNFEHVLSAAFLLKDILLHAPGLKLLITSRERLHLYGEHAFVLEPLPLPHLAELPPLETLRSYAGIALFEDRARSVNPHFAVTLANMEAVTKLCAYVDGLPFAIELAAARVATLSPTAMDQMMTSRLSLIAAEKPDIPVHQRSLRTAIAWSYTLLDQPGQHLLNRLSIFKGSWDAAAAAAVGELQDGAVASEKLRLLFDKHLVQLVQKGDYEPRYQLLPSIQEYAFEQLSNNEELETIHERHACYFVTLAELAEPALKGHGQHLWIHRLAQDHNNYRSALKWTIASGRIDLAGRLVKALWRFWAIHGDLSNGRFWLHALRAHAHRLPPHLRAHILLGSAVFAWLHEEFDPAAKYGTESLALGQLVNDDSVVAAALNILGNIARDQGDNLCAAALYEESLSVARRVNDEHGVAVVLGNMGEAAIRQGRLAEAQDLVLNAMTSYRHIGYQRGEARALGNLANVAYRLGAHQEARRLFEESIKLCDLIGDKTQLASMLFWLGRILVEQDELAEARHAFEESAKLYHELGFADDLADVLKSLAKLTVLEHERQANFQHISDPSDTTVLRI